MIDVVAAIIKKNNKYFIAKRNRNKHLGNQWEFPGGKVNNDETFEIALKREILEELSIDIIIMKKIISKKYIDEKINILLHYFLCKPINDNIKLSEHEDMKWIEKKDFVNFKLTLGDSQVVKYL